MKSNLYYFEITDGLIYLFSYFFFPQRQKDILKSKEENLKIVTREIE